MYSFACSDRIIRVLFFSNARVSRCTQLLGDPIFYGVLSYVNYFLFFFHCHFYRVRR